jgi:hypothetical protein
MTCSCVSVVARYLSNLCILVLSIFFFDRLVVLHTYVEQQQSFGTKYLIIFSRRVSMNKKLSVLTSSLVFIFALNIISIEDVAGQSDATKTNKKQDIFKVLLTVDGINHNTGDIVTVVSINGESKSKLFDDTKTYLTSVNSNGGGGIIEHVATFPGIIVNTGDEYKACALLVQASQLFCQTGNNSPALRPEIVDLHIQEQSAITAASTIQTPSVIDTEEEENEG